ncbi:MAG TPA: hypothetical protein VKP65_04000 [Rhodothermales bacterium]|nr:hypothetical protein [Rhodothermales bacterium]
MKTRRRFLHILAGAPLLALVPIAGIAHEDEFARRIRVARRLNEIQARELMKMQEESLKRLKEIRDTLNA